VGSHGGSNKYCQNRLYDEKWRKKIIIEIENLRGQRWQLKVTLQWNLVKTNSVVYEHPVITNGFLRKIGSF
jgi:hypothetical protein